MPCDVFALLCYDFIFSPLLMVRLLGYSVIYIDNIERTTALFPSIEYYFRPFYVSDFTPCTIHTLLAPVRGVCKYLTGIRDCLEVRTRDHVFRPLERRLLLGQFIPLLIVYCPLQTRLLVSYLVVYP